MKRNLRNIDEVRHERELDKVNDLLREGWIIITTAKTTYHEDVDFDEITYSLGHVIDD